MCLIVEKSTPVQVAEKDITVYKSIHSASMDGNYCCPYYQRNFLYRKDRVYKTKIKSDNFSKEDYQHSFADQTAEEAYCSFNKQELIAYGEGFHSCKDIVRALSLSHNAIAEFLIPKGTRFVCDVTGLIVSEAIIFSHIVKRPENPRLLFYK